MEVLNMLVLVYYKFENSWLLKIFNIAKFILSFKDVSLNYEIAFVEQKLVHVEVM